MAKLSEQRSIEAEIAKKLLAEFRGDDGFMLLNHWRADDLEMKICEALWEAFCHGMDANWR